MTRFSAGVAALFVIVAGVGPWLLPEDALRIDLLHELAPPSIAGRLGRAENGVDVLASLVLGARTSLVVGAVTALVCAVLGGVAGAGAALAGPRIDALFLRVVDTALAFPSILLALYLASLLPPSTTSVIVALCATGWVGFARVARAKVLELVVSERLVGARVLGASWARVLVVHVAPAAAPALLAQASFALSGAILAEGALAFLGVGAPPGHPSWGALLDEGTACLLVAPHVALAAGAVLATTVVAFHGLGRALHEKLDLRRG
jgi:peptide/nickel transport system permease protein